MKDNLIIARDPYNGTLFMERKGEYLVGVMNTEKEAIAREFIQKVIQKIQ
jgi:hypothetical protein